MAKNLTTTGDMVSYAMFLIDRRIEYNKNAVKEELERVTSDLLSLNDNISIKSELETVPENDPVKSKPSPKTRSPVIIEGIPLSKTSPIMVETVLSDEASQVSVLRDHLVAQQAEQSKVNQAILQSFENLDKGNTIHDKGADMMTKMVVQSKSAPLPPLPTECTDTTMGQWENGWIAIILSYQQHLGILMEFPLLI